MKKFNEYAGLLALFIIVALISRKIYLYQKEKKQLKDKGVSDKDASEQATTRALARF